MLRKVSSVFVALAVFLLVAGAAQSGLAEPRSTEEMLEDRVLGDPEAPITIVEYSSLTCPHCANFHIETLPQLKKAYLDTGKAKLVYRDYPLGADGRSTIAAMLARCAPPERYFGFLEALFRSQKSWALATDPFAVLGQIAQLGGVSPEDFEACMTNEALFNGIRKAKADATREVGIERTPTFIINDEKRIETNLSFETFDAILRDLAP